ncbi:MmyB family transcriptional regulator [Streptomyces decoyicus]|uniref:MmyB family transcriptional regulator n=1 Tax=Streptomyces decoyicus TaxID=249567 RepID=UPI0037FBC986
MKTASPARNVRRGSGGPPALVAQLRSSYGRHVGEPAWESLIGRLSRSAWISRGWRRPGASRRRGTV